MSTAARPAADLDQRTYLPNPDDSVAPVYDFMTRLDQAGRDRPAARCLLAGPEAGDQVELPAELYQVLRQVVAALRHNLAVTVAPTTQTLTTQQAADLLGVSRPTLIRLCDEGKISFERPGAHRRLRLTDVLDFRRQMREERYAALAATAVDPDDEDDVDAMLGHLRDARRAAASRRTTRSTT